MTNYKNQAEVNAVECVKYMLSVPGIDVNVKHSWRQNTEGCCSRRYFMHTPISVAIWRLIEMPHLEENDVRELINWLIDWLLLSNIRHCALVFWRKIIVLHWTNALYQQQSQTSAITIRLNIRLLSFLSIILYVPIRWVSFYIYLFECCRQNQHYLSSEQYLVIGQWT